MGRPTDTTDQSLDEIRHAGAILGRAAALRADSLSAFVDGVRAGVGWVPGPVTAASLVALSEERDRYRSTLHRLLERHSNCRTLCEADEHDIRWALDETATRVGRRG